jgi:integrase
LQTLGKVLALARRDKLIGDYPPPPAGAKSQGRIRVYTREEEAAILTEFGRIHPHMVDFTVAMIDTGMRLGELLDRGLLHHSRAAATIELWLTKNASGRVIPLTARANDALTRWLSQTCILTKDQVEGRWQAMRRNIGVTDEQFVIHALRHTCCTRLLRGGMHPFEVMKWMGHRDIKSTLRYTHLVTEDIRKGAAVLEAAR